MKKLTTLIILALIINTTNSFSQVIDSTKSQNIDSTKSIKADIQKKNFYMKEAVTLTNKGISYIPNLSLGKPAIIFDLSMANQKLSFEPQLRFAINGEPWAFLFPVRYKIKSKGVFQMSAGVNPLLNFKNITVVNKGVYTTELVNRRYLGGEFKPNFFVTKEISIGLLYLYFSGVSSGTVKNTNFISLNTNFSNIKLGQKFFVKFNPQLYYLNQDGKEGLYFNSILTLLKRNFPFSIQTNMNTTIETNIPKSEKFIWNVSLIYSSNQTFTRN